VPAIAKLQVAELSYIHTKGSMMDQTIIAQHETLPTVEFGPLRYQLIGHSDHMTVIRWFFPDGAQIPDHHHVQEQVTYILRGALEMTINGQKVVLNANDSVVIASDVPHSVRALSETEALDVFSPVRLQLPKFFEPKS
jgi:quercetin dioxygenase-like cupin family protein